MQVIALTEELLTTAQQNDNAGLGAGTSADASPRVLSNAVGLLYIYIRDYNLKRCLIFHGSS